MRKKGLKPWLRTPVSAADVKEHTVWLDEPSALAKIEARLGEEIARLEKSLVSSTTEKTIFQSSSSLTDSLARFLEANKARVDVRSGAVVRPEDAAAALARAREANPRCAALLYAHADCLERRGAEGAAACKAVYEEVLDAYERECAEREADFSLKKEDAPEGDAPAFPHARAPDWVPSSPT